jgi:hypothetical protein
MLQAGQYQDAVRVFRTLLCLVASRPQQRGLLALHDNLHKLGVQPHALGYGILGTYLLLHPVCAWRLQLNRLVLCCAAVWPTGLRAQPSRWASCASSCPTGRSGCMGAMTPRVHHPWQQGRSGGACPHAAQQCGSSTWTCSRRCVPGVCCQWLAAGERHYV